MMRPPQDVPTFVWATARWLARVVPDASDREDVEQELAIAGWLALGTHTAPAPLRWWVQMKMRYALAELGKARYRPMRWNEAGPDAPLDGDGGDGWFAREEPGYGLVDDEDARAWAVAAVALVLEGLPVEHAGRLAEHYLRGVTLRELGARRGVTEATEWGAMRTARRLARVQADRLGITWT